MLRLKLVAEAVGYALAGLAVISLTILSVYGIVALVADLALGRQ